MFMLSDIPLFPPTGSEEAHQIDLLYFFISAVTIVMTLLIFAAVIYFAYRYRRTANPIPTQIEGSTKLELTWSILPFLVMLVMFAWGAQLYYAAQHPPKDAMEVFVTGKQWMWKIQYPNGGREINELHVPVGQRGKTDHGVGRRDSQLLNPGVPREARRGSGPLRQPLVQATKPGRYHLFCAEYCGTEHSGMIGWVT